MGREILTGILGADHAGFHTHRWADAFLDCCAEILGAKWTAVLVHDLSEGPRRFTQLEHSCKGISPRTLSERLRALEQEEIVVRRSYAESPPRVEYELTDKGQALLPIIEEMRRYGHGDPMRHVLWKTFARTRRA